MTVSNTIDPNNPNDSGWIVQRSKHSIGLTVWDKDKKELCFVWLTFGGIDVHSVYPVSLISDSLIKLYKPDWSSIERQVSEYFIK